MRLFRKCICCLFRGLEWQLCYLRQFVGGGLLYIIKMLVTSLVCIVLWFTWGARRRKTWVHVLTQLWFSLGDLGPIAASQPHLPYKGIVKIKLKMGMMYATLSMLKQEWNEYKMKKNGIPMTLQWHCAVRSRERLFSMVQPAVIKSLPSHCPMQCSNVPIPRGKMRH